MAPNNSYLSEEELNKRILLVADYMIATGSSTRKTAKYISENYFSISNATVYDYVKNRLIEIDKERYNKVMEILNKNAPQTIEIEGVQARVYKGAKLILEGYTVKEVTKILQSTFDIIYDDVTVRLSLLDKSLARAVKLKLTEHRLANLEKPKR